MWMAVSTSNASRDRTMADTNKHLKVSLGTGTESEAEVEVIYRDTVVVGSGAAAFNAIDWLHDLGRKSIVLVTEGIDMGTSRNTGSDKQTYYKMSLGPGEADSVSKMSNVLFEGEGVDGRTALAEAANSVRCFMKLANLGVPFPTDAYGQYVGYKTDHDPAQRGTSAGPLTSKFMTEALERSVRSKQIEIQDRLCAFKILTDGNDAEPHVRGVACLKQDAAAQETIKLVLICCNNVIWCTGGPAAVYRTVVYPTSQTGMTGAVLEAGAEAANLQEWQYGLASIAFRWNVSGTYQQVLPRYVAVDAQGEEHEFLSDYGMDPLEATNMVFLKGYQWPFDVTKRRASSRIDLAVYDQIAVKGNRVFMDFRSNPAGLDEHFSGLSDEARSYLENSGALFGTPLDRLKKMNPLAIDLYRDHGIDLEHEMLEVAVCAQHNNGGIRVDDNWQTRVDGLYVAGEAAGTFGVHRPGGSALNSTQVGSMRAAQHIACTVREGIPDGDVWEKDPETLAESIVRELAVRVTGTDTTSNIHEELRGEMTRVAAQVRKVDAVDELVKLLSHIREETADKKVWTVKNIADLPHMLKARDTSVTQEALLNAIAFSAHTFGSRGSALVQDAQGSFIETAKLVEGHPVELLMTVTSRKTDGSFSSRTEQVSELPQPNGWFETVWAEHRTSRTPLTERK